MFASHTGLKTMKGGVFLLHRSSEYFIRQNILEAICRLVYSNAGTPAGFFFSLYIKSVFFLAHSAFFVDHVTKQNVITENIFTNDTRAQ